MFYERRLTMTLRLTKTIRALVVALTTTFVVAGCGIFSQTAKETASSIVISPAVIKYKETKTINVTGSGFTPGAIATVGVEGIGKWKKEAPAAKDLWIGLARVKKDQTFAVTIELTDNLWKVQGLSGKYTVAVKDDAGKRATAPLMIETAKKAK
jgi:hypothetical protein